MTNDPIIAYNALNETSSNLAFFSYPDLSLDRLPAHTNILAITRSATGKYK